MATINRRLSHECYIECEFYVERNFLISSIGIKIVAHICFQFLIYYRLLLVNPASNKIEPLRGDAISRN